MSDPQVFVGVQPGEARMPSSKHGSSVRWLCRRPAGARSREFRGPWGAALIILFAAGIAFAQGANTGRESPADLVGQPAPRFILRTLNPEVSGPRYLLREDVGPTARTPVRSVLLDFAASWCAPCRKELAYLKRLGPKLDSAGIRVVVVVIDDTPEGIETMRKMVTDELQLTFPVVSDRFQVLARRYRVDTLPLAVIIDRAGRIEYVQEGFGKDSLSRLTDALGLSNPPVE